MRWAEKFSYLTRDKHSPTPMLKGMGEHYLPDYATPFCTIWILTSKKMITQ